MFAAVMALKAYSMEALKFQLRFLATSSFEPIRRHTDLVQATLVGEDGDVSIETRAPCMGMLAAAPRVWSGLKGDLPDMAAVTEVGGR